MKYVAALLLLLTPLPLLADTIRLGQLRLNLIQQQYGRPRVDHSVDGNPIAIGKRHFDHGIGSHAESVWWIDLGGRATQFNAFVGIDDEVASNPGSSGVAVEFKVLGDRKTLFRSGPMKAGQDAKQISVDLTGVHILALMIVPVSDTVDFAHSDWADAEITYAGDRPISSEPPQEPAEILTPKSPDTPRINGARIVGVRPGHPLLYTIAATGARPMTFAAAGLPDGLSLDSSTGQITGSAATPGSHTVKLTATNSLGSTSADLRIIVGDTIALTPPMGWNSWNCFAQSVSDQKVRAAADAMVNSTLIQHGWTYINIDDCWEVRATRPAAERRDADGLIKTNTKFPDMKSLADYVHSKGLRIGLYSSPGPSTCGGFTASYQFEKQDADQYARWGFDYLKYDWCSYGRIADPLRKAPGASERDIDAKPYLVMRDALLAQNRDILFSFCQYGMGNVWEWGAETGGNCWRTTGDITDNWISMSGIGFNQSGHEKYAGPGHWNDPDMLVVGKVGWGSNLRPTHLTPNEQYTHITLWSLLSAPLLIGCDMTQMDGFTLSLLTNDEVIAVNQDSLGKQASRIVKDSETEIWAKDLEDGSKAVGLFNRSEDPASVTVKWSDLGLNSPQSVRDLWRQKDLGISDAQFTIQIPRHGAVLIKVSAPAK